MPTTIEDLVEERYRVLGEQIRGVKRNVRKERSLRSENPARRTARGKFPTEAGEETNNALHGIKPETRTSDWVIVNLNFTNTSTWQDIVLFNTHIFESESVDERITNVLAKNGESGVLKKAYSNVGINSSPFPPRYWYIQGDLGNGVFPSGEAHESFTIDASDTSDTEENTGIVPRVCLWMIIQIKGQNYHIVPYRKFLSEDAGVIFNNKFKRNSSNELIILFQDDYGNRNNFHRDYGAETPVRIWYVRDYQGGFGKGQGKFPDIGPKGDEPDFVLRLTSFISTAVAASRTYISTSSKWILIESKVEESSDTYYSYDFYPNSYFFTNEIMALTRHNSATYMINVSANQIWYRRSGGDGNNDITLSLYYL